MAIEVVVNGFYRSGTTMVWEMLKKSNPEKKVFYEPLNPYLSYYIRHEAFYSKPNPLHNLLLFQEYIEAGDDLLEGIIDKHPSRDMVFPDNTIKLYEYLNIFDSLENTVLQANRLHFHLTDVHEKYNAKIVHIIRNPFDAYQSILTDYYRTSYKSNWKFKYFLQYKLRKKYEWHANHFDIQPIYNFIYRKYGYSDEYLQKIEDKTFKYFLVDWIVCNYYAIRSIEKSEGLLVSYEQIMFDTKNTLNKIKGYTNLNCDVDVVKSTKHHYSYNDYKKKYNLYEYTQASLLNEMAQYIYEKVQ